MAQTTRIKEKLNLPDAGKLLQEAIRRNVAKGACYAFASGEASRGKPRENR